MTTDSWENCKNKLLRRSTFLMENPDGELQQELSGAQTALRTWEAEHPKVMAWLRQDGKGRRLFGRTYPKERAIHDDLLRAENSVLHRIEDRAQALADPTLAALLTTAPDPTALAERVRVRHVDLIAEQRYVRLFAAAGDPELAPIMARVDFS